MMQHNDYGREDDYGSILEGNEQNAPNEQNVPNCKYTDDLSKVSFSKKALVWSHWKRRISNAMGYEPKCLLCGKSKHEHKDTITIGKPKLTGMIGQKGCIAILTHEANERRLKKERNERNKMIGKITAGIAGVGTLVSVIVAAAVTASENTKKETKKKDNIKNSR